MTKKRIVVFTFLVIIASGFLIIILCNSYIGFRTILLKEKNPTSYVFHIPVDRLRNVIVYDFSKDRSKDIDDLRSVQEISRKQWSVHDANCSYNSEKVEKIFEKPRNKLDLYLTPSGSPIISYSKVYLKFRKPLEYYAEFQLHFASINEQETKIEVITYNTEVLYWGFDIFGTGHSYVNTKKVEPTTIEEYEILLRIGNLAGEKDMPPLKLPE